MKVSRVKEADLTGKCGECISYIPIKSIDKGKLTEYSKGTCDIKKKIVSRSDKKCKKNFKKKEGRKINE